MATIKSGLSPAVRTREIDVSGYASNQVSTVALLIGNAEKGPAFKIDVVPNETEFIKSYGTPTSDTAKTFFASSTYFARGSNLVFTRVVDRPTAIVSAVGFDFNTDGEPNGELPAIANLDPLLYNNDVTEYAESIDGSTIVDQDVINEYYNTGKKSVQAFYTRHTMNRAFPRERNTEYEVGDLIHDGWYESTESGQVENFSGGDLVTYPNGYVYVATTAGLTSAEYNSADQMTDLGVTGDVLAWDIVVGENTTDGDVIWERVEWTEETYTGGIRFKHGTTLDPEYYDPEDTTTFDYNVEINDEAKEEDLIISAVGPSSLYDDYYVFLLGYEDAQNLKKYPYKLTMQRETLQSDSFVPEEFASWGGEVKRCLNKVTYKELIAEFDFLSELPTDLPQNSREFGLFLLTYDSVSGSWGNSEYYKCSTDDTVFDDNGNKLFVEDVINNSSYEIRAKMSEVAKNSEVTTTLPIALKGGTSGELTNLYDSVERGELGTVTLASEVVNACDIYRSEEVEIDIIIDGDAPLGVKKEFAKLAEDLNGEAFAILDTPEELKTEDAYIKWINEDLLLGGSSYAGVYHNRLKIYDKYNGIYRYVSPSGTIAGKFAEVDRIAYPWYAVAGSTRGTLPEVIDIRENFGLPSRDMLYANSINPVAIINNAISIYGQKTTLDKNSYLNRINVRRLINYLKRRARKAAEAFIFEFNDVFTRELATSKMNGLLGFVEARRGLEEYLVVCDESNNTPDVIENNELYIDLYVKPTAVAEFVWLQFYITKSSVNLQELVTRVTP